MEKHVALQLYEFSDPSTGEPLFVIQSRGVVQALVRSLHVERRLGLSRGEQPWAVDEVSGGPHLAPVFADPYFMALEPHGSARCH